MVSFGRRRFVRGEKRGDIFEDVKVYSILPPGSATGVEASSPSERKEFVSIMHTIRTDSNGERQK